MKKSNVTMTVKALVKNVGKKTISFDYPIQREGEQWNNLQKSLLIHSLAEDFPVPPLYSIVEEEVFEEGKKPVNVYKVLDGKQRMTNITNFVNNEFFLHEDTPHAVIEGKKYELAERLFSELDEEVKEAILDFNLLIYKLDEVTDEQIEELFYRLNNGTPLSKQQKAKAKMGTEWAKTIQGLVSHDLIKEKASFTALQIQKADHETALLQTMMLVDENYDWKSISSNEIFDYAQTFKGSDDKMDLVEKVKVAMDYLNVAFEDKESVLLKKVHFPMTLLSALKAIELDKHPMVFSDWREEFKTALKKNTGTRYKSFGGAGSVKKEKTMGRIAEMQKHMEEYFATRSPQRSEELEIVKNEEKLAGQTA